ncbi:MAG: branched-chain amino acid ABC transporter substrate-binding protein, partial [Rhodospirillaceae bacterium]|nr:branched-chain amino acid ABC transporter substrate-binding protein [Rhodospirillaceae bacterium]
MQNRFRRTASRWMTSVDYAAWVAVRSVGEAVTRSKSIEPAKVEAYMLSPDFSIAAYKGIKVTYRPWNGQLRQRILLASPRAMVSVSPQKEYLHQRSETDSLGFDKPESKCKLER